MIVKNEEQTLGNCLESVHGIVDEIIIVDTGSTDKTKQIARKYGAEIFDFKWIDDFSAARNFSFSKATCDYILWLDADDIITKPNQLLFMQYKKNIRSNIDSIFLKYNVAFDSDGNPTFNYFRERIVKRENNFQWNEPVHEYLSTGTNSEYWEIAVTHNKLSTVISQRNLKIYENIIASGKDLSTRGLYYYARELKTHTRDVDAIEYFNKFLNSGLGWKEDCIMSCLELSYLYEKTGAKELSYKILFDSFIYDLPRGEICCRLGELYQNDNNYLKSIYWYEIAANTDIPNTLGFIQPDYYNFIPFISLAVLYDKQGLRAEAIKFHNKSKELKPNHPSILYNEEYFNSIK